MKKKNKIDINSSIKYKNSQNKKEEIYYPQYYYNCHCSFVSKKRHSKCWNCQSNNTINYFNKNL